MEWNFSPDGPLRPIVSVDRSAGHSFVAQPNPTTTESGQASVDYALSLPQNYTPGYAYPVIVWFHEAGGNELDAGEWVPQISPQNYVGLGLRGPLPIVQGMPEQRTWSTGPQHLQWLEDQLAVALMDVARERSIHWNRIVAAGIGRGATIALEMLLRQPALFAAAACLNANLPDNLRLDRWGQYGGRGLWLGHSQLVEGGHRAPAIASARLLQAAGIDVCPRTYDDDEWPLDIFGREIDRWLLPRLCGDTVIA